MHGLQSAGNYVGMAVHQFIFLRSPALADGSTLLYVDGVGTTLTEMGRQPGIVKFCAPDEDNSDVVWKKLSVAPAGQPRPSQAGVVAQQPQAQSDSAPRVWQMTSSAGAAPPPPPPPSAPLPSAFQPSVQPQPRTVDASSAPPPSYERAMGMGPVRISSI